MTNIQNLKKELVFLYKVAQSVHSLELDELLDEIVKIATDVTHADSRSAVLLTQGRPS